MGYTRFWTPSDLIRQIKRPGYAFATIQMVTNGNPANLENIFFRIKLAREGRFNDRQSHAFQPKSRWLSVP
jgi:hypothetical protein